MLGFWSTGSIPSTTWGPVSITASICGPKTNKTWEQNVTSPTYKETLLLGTSAVVSKQGRLQASYPYQCAPETWHLGSRTFCLRGCWESKASHVTLAIFILVSFLSWTVRNKLHDLFVGPTFSSLWDRWCLGVTWYEIEWENLLRNRVERTYHES